MKYFIRFGKPPKKYSKMWTAPTIYHTSLIGREYPGISVFEARKRRSPKNTWDILTDDLRTHGLSSIADLLYMASKDKKIPVYLMTGTPARWVDLTAEEKVKFKDFNPGKHYQKEPLQGTDGEPLLRDYKIIKEISPKDIYCSAVDWDPAQDYDEEIAMSNGPQYEIKMIIDNDEGGLVKLLKHLKKMGDVGSSGEITVTSGDGPATFGWDGDGSDRIKALEIQTIEEETAMEMNQQLKLLTAKLQRRGEVELSTKDLAWWRGLGDEGRRAYLKVHPKSKFRHAKVKTKSKAIELVKQQQTEAARLELSSLPIAQLVVKAQAASVNIRTVLANAIVATGPKGQEKQMTELRMAATPLVKALQNWVAGRDKKDKTQTEKAIKAWEKVSNSKKADLHTLCAASYAFLDWIDRFLPAEGPSSSASAVFKAWDKLVAVTISLEKSISPKKKAKAELSNKDFVKFTNYDDSDDLLDDPEIEVWHENFDGVDVAIFATEDGERCVGAWYTRQKFGTHNLKFKGGIEEYIDADPYFPDTK